LPNYEHRPSASEIVLRHSGKAGANAVTIKSGPLNATVSLSIGRTFPGHELGLALDVHLDPGWHIYGKPLPSNYQALELVLENQLIDDQSLEFPAAQPLSLKALGETLPVYIQGFRALGKIGIKWSPPMPAPFLKGLGDKIEPGVYSIPGTLGFQACSIDFCEPPQAIKFDLPLTIEAGIGPAPKKAA
jgi:Disulphide bond corrector protein DsbC